MHTPNTFGRKDGSVFWLERIIVTLILFLIFIPLEAFPQGFGSGRTSEDLFPRDDSRTLKNTQEEFRLFPGESYTSLGVTVTWEVNDTTQEAKEQNHFLHLKGPNSEIRDVTIEAVSGQKTAFLDDVLIYYSACVEEIRMRTSSDPSSRGGGGFRIEKHIRSLICGAMSQSSSFTVMHRVDNPRMFVSHVNPLRINQFRLTVSSETISYPDGSDYMEIIATDSVSGETETIPAANDANRSIGRFSVYVKSTNVFTKTVGLHVTTQPDLSIRGEDAWAGDFSSAPNTPLEEVLKNLAKDYGFETEWLEHEGHPESVQFAKETRSVNRVAGETVDAVVQDIDPSHPVTFEWKTPTLLSVYPAGYEEVLKGKELAEARDLAKENFEKTHRFETQNYHLTEITSITAKAVIDQELRAYALLGTAVETYKAAGMENNPNALIERCIADEKANTVIVTAIPETHQKIEELLARMEAVLEVKQAEKAEPLELYQIEVALLQAVETSVSSATPVYMAKLNQTIEDISVTDEDIEEVIQMLSELTGVSINVDPQALGQRVTLNIVYSTPAIEILRLIADMHLLWIDFQHSSVLLRWGRKDTRVPPADPSDYGLKPEDLDRFKINEVSELGRSIQSITNSPAGGTFSVAMGERFQCEMSFQDFREPYLIVKGIVEQGDRAIVDSTLFLEKDKPSILAITNMRDTLILVVRLLEIR